MTIQKKLITIIISALLLSSIIIYSCTADDSSEALSNEAPYTLEHIAPIDVDHPTADPQKWGSNVYKIVDEMPLIASCSNLSDDYSTQRTCSDKELLTYLYTHLKYPELARKSGIEGRVYVQFVINADGTMGKRQLIKEIGGGCGDAALSVLDKMSDEVRWTPGLIDGQSVSVLYTLPVTY